MFPQKAGYSRKNTQFRNIQTESYCNGGCVWDKQRVLRTEENQGKRRREGEVCDIFRDNGSQCCQDSQTKS